MDSNPLISVIVAIYNVEKYLEQCVNSIISQSYKNIEIILMDDGSSDKSRSICDQLAEKDKRIIVLHQRNGGVSVARNNGLRVAKGEWIMFVDGDDWLTENAIEILNETMIQEEGCDVLVGSYFREDLNGEEFSGSKVAPNSKYVFDLNNCRKKIISYTLEEVDAPELSEIKCNLSSPWGKIYRKEFLDKSNILFVPGMKRAQDEIFNLYVMQNARRLVVINAPVYHYRIREDSICRRVAANKVDLNIYSVWDQEVKKFLTKFYEKDGDDLYALFMYRRIREISRIFIRECISGFINVDEAAKDIKSALNEPQFRKMVLETYDLRQSKYFSKKERLVLMLFKYQLYYVYVIWQKLKNNCSNI